MSLLHPARAGSPLSVWFIDGVPVRLFTGYARFRVVGEPKCADINERRYWRVRAVSDAGQLVTLDIRERVDGDDATTDEPGDWILAGVDEDSTRIGRR